MFEKRNIRYGQRTYFEQPLGVICGFYIEPGPEFVDSYEIEERKAIQEIEREADERIKQENRVSGEQTKLFG